MRRLFLRDCSPGDLIEDVYVLTGKQLGTTQTNKHFIKAFVGDRSGQVTARMWNATRDIFNALPDSGFIRLRGRVENYQNNLQLIIEQVWPAKEGTYEVGDLLPQTERNINEMCRKLHELCESIQNRHLAALVQCYLDDEQLMGNFCKAPAAQGFHHAFIGGLLEHTLNAMEVGDAVVRFYPGLNRDLVLAGIFLHDIAKTWELCYDCAFGYTDGGQLVGHIVKSAMWIEAKARDAERVLGERFPQPLIDVLQHIILSHHGNLSTGFGSAKNPSTPEAMMVHFIDDMDAKMQMALCATRGAGVAGDGNWTEYMKAFNGRLYRPDVAPADAGEGEPLPTEDDASGAAAADARTLKIAISNPLFAAVEARK
jgi:3'-5' exoribonuclease